MKPTIAVELGADGVPTSATATARIAATPARVWQCIENVEAYPAIVPMLSKVKRQGDRVTVHLKFRITLFSVGFDFTADATYEPGKWLELKWVAGEPRNLRIRYDIDDGGDGTCVTRASISFDTMSLGWLAKYFLKHHPEIQYGIFPGCALALVDSMRKAAEAKI